MGEERAFLICLSGIDGSGKTTLARWLVGLMQERGIKTRYVYGRYSAFLLVPFFSLGRRLFLRGENASADYAGYTKSKRAVFRTPLFSLIYQSILLFDYFFQVTLKVRLPLLLGQSIICDRYVYDTVVTDLAVDLNYGKGKMAKVIEACLQLMPKPDLTFLVDVSEEVAYQRKNDVPSIEYLSELRVLYKWLGGKYGMTVLQGTKELAELKDIVKQRITEEVLQPSCVRASDRDPVEE